MSRIALGLCLLSLASGCASGLRDTWRESPRGAFGDASLAALPPSPTRTPLTPPSPTPSPTPSPSPPPALTDVSAEELLLAGVVVEPMALAELQQRAWQVPRALPRSQARVAFLARSSAIRQLVERYRASFNRLGQIAYLNDLVRRFDAFASTLQTGATTPHIRPQLDKQFPFSGVSELQADIAALDIASAKVELERALLDQLVELERAWQGALYWQRAGSIIAQTLELAERVADAADARYRAGQVSYANRVQAEIRVTELAERRKTATREAAAARDMIAAMLELDPGDFRRVRLVADALEPPRLGRALVAERAATAIAVRAARLQLIRSTLMVQLAERQLLPPLAPGLGAPPMRDPGHSPVYVTAAPFLSEMQHGLEGAIAALTSIVRLAPAQARARWTALDEALRRRRINGTTQAERAERSVRVSEQAYRAGQASFPELDGAVQLHLQIAMAEAAARRDAFVEFARLQLIIGVHRDAAPEEK